jgi:hypothetical protein
MVLRPHHSSPFGVCRTWRAYFRFRRHPGSPPLSKNLVTRSTIPLDMWRRIRHRFLIASGYLGSICAEPPVYGSKLRAYLASQGDAAAAECARKSTDWRRAPDVSDRPCKKQNIRPAGVVDHGWRGGISEWHFRGLPRHFAHGP